MKTQKYDLYAIDFKDEQNITNYDFHIKQAILSTVHKDYSVARENLNKAKEFAFAIKEKSIREKNELVANASFLLKKYVDLLTEISKFWELSQNVEYQSAWSSLQNAIDDVKILKKFSEGHNEKKLNNIENYLLNIEKLYPYSLFMSVEFIAQQLNCSICNKSVFDESCEHVGGNLYWGEMASRVASNIKLLGSALVESPADKRCIVQLDCNKSNIELTQFRHVHSLIQYLKTPFQAFDLHLTVRTLPRSHYATWPDGDPCPCQSKKAFKDCCSAKSTVDNPHYKIELHPRLVFT